MVATRKITSLYFETHTISGKTEMSELSAAPAPMATKKAGKAQHKIVLVLVNRVKKATFLLEFKVANASFFFILSANHGH